MSFCDACLRIDKCTATERAIKDASGSCIQAEQNVRGRFRTGERIRGENGRVHFITLDRVPGFHHIHAPVDNLR